MLHFNHWKLSATDQESAAREQCFSRWLLWGLLPPLPQFPSAYQLSLKLRNTLLEEPNDRAGILQLLTGDSMDARGSVTPP